MSRIPIITFEFVPRGGDPGHPVKVHGLQEYSPGNHSGRVDAYLIKVPEQYRGDLPASEEVYRWETVTSVLANWFGENEEDVRTRLKRTYADKVQFPDLS
jgi:hypothetical protein